MTVDAIADCIAWIVMVSSFIGGTVCCFRQYVWENKCEYERMLYISSRGADKNYTAYLPMITMFFILSVLWLIIIT